MGRHTVYIHNIRLAADFAGEDSLHLFLVHFYFAALFMVAEEAGEDSREGFSLKWAIVLASKYLFLVFRAMRSRSI